MGDNDVTDTKLRHKLDQLADEIAPQGDPLPGVLAGAARIRRRRLLAVAGLSIVAVGAGAVAARTLDRPELTLPASNGPFLGWPTYGNAARVVVDAAIGAWERDAGGPHTGVQALAAVTGTDIGAVVILQGYDQDRRARLAFLTGAPDDPAGSRVWLRLDRPAPRPDLTKAVALLTPRVGLGVGELAKRREVEAPPGSQAATHEVREVWAVALAAPGVEHVRLRSTTVDQSLGQVGGPRSRLQVNSLDEDATTVTTTVRGYIDGTEVLNVPVWGSFNDPFALRAKVVDRPGPGVIIVAPTGERAAPVGALVATSDGLVGVTTGYGDGHVKVQLATAKGFRIAAHAAISGHPGVLFGTGDGLRFAAEKGDALDVNRVVVADPAQRGSGFGAVTAGHVTGGRGGRSAAVRPSADPDVNEVRILTAPP